MTLLFENIRLALTSLKSNKMRALLTMLGIIIGISSVIAIMTIGNSVSKKASASMSSMGVNNINVMINVREYEDEVTDEGYIFKADEVNFSSMDSDNFFSREMLAAYCEEYPDEIVAISAEESMDNLTAEYGKKNVSVSLDGISMGYCVANEKNMLAGRWFSETEWNEGREVVVISSKMVDKLFEGDAQAAIGKTIQTNAAGGVQEFGIVGVYDDSEQTSLLGISFGSNSYTCYIPLKKAQELKHRDFFMNFTVVAADGVDPNDFSSKTQRFFNNYFRNNRIFEVQAFSMSSMVEKMEDLLGAITTAISVIAGIALLVGGIGVMNIMLVSITERTREIGTRKALGAPNSSIRMQFIVEAVVICLIGGIIGVLLGIGLGSLITSLMKTEASASLSSIVLALGFSMGIGIFFGYYPANKAAKMDPIEALRYE